MSNRGPSLRAFFPDSEGVLFCGPKSVLPEKMMTTEDLCLKCGRCCRKKFLGLDGAIVYSNEACKHLDPETKLCTVYERRFIVHRGCIPIHVAKMEGFLPAHCAYVRDDPDYKPPREATPAELRARMEARL